MVLSVDVSFSARRAGCGVHASSSLTKKASHKRLLPACEAFYVLIGTLDYRFTFSKEGDSIAKDPGVSRRRRKKMELPKTYGELIAGNHDGWHIETVYYLEIENAHMRSFPAIIKGTERAIIALDQTLLGRVQNYLPPRHSRISSSIFMVNRELGIGYPTWNDGEPQKLFSWTEFSVSIAHDPWPFEWIRGNVEDARRFARILESHEPRKEAFSFVEESLFPHAETYPRGICKQS
jgi:hypothetical protein